VSVLPFIFAVCLYFTARQIVLSKKRLLTFAWAMGSLLAMVALAGVSVWMFPSRAEGFGMLVALLAPVVMILAARNHSLSNRRM
jgi:hypothetical protein